jgi:hypothetical protein
MKDSELRELFADLKLKIIAATATVVGGDPKEIIDRLTRIQELLEQGRRFGPPPLPPPLELPSPRVPLIIGALLGALIFAAGMFAGTFLK